MARRQSHADGEIEWSHKQAIDTGHVNDLLDLLESLYGLDHGNHSDLFIGLRKIHGTLSQAGAGRTPSRAAASTAGDPRMKELVDEIVRLSMEFGILTEYTAFLAREGTDLREREEILNTVDENLRVRAVQVRSGLSAVNQSLNYQEQAAQKTLKKHNDYWDPQMQRVQNDRVQQVNDLTFYQRGDRWVDSRVAARGAGAKADREVRIGSPEFSNLAEKLARQNRPGAVAFQGEIMMEVDGEVILCK